MNPFHQIRVMLVSKEENLLNLPIILMLVVLYLLGHKIIKVDNSNFCIQSNIGIFVDTKRLQLTGLTSEADQDSAVPLTQDKKRKLVFKFGGASSSSPHLSIGAGDAGPSVRAGKVAPPSPDVEEIIVAPTASLSLPGGLPPNFIMDEEKKCASSSLLPTASKIEELRDIAHTWNEHYVGLKDAYLILLERLRAAEDAASESKKRGECVSSRIKRLESDLAFERAESAKLVAESNATETIRQEQAAALEEAKKSFLARTVRWYTSGLEELERFSRTPSR